VEIKLPTRTAVNRVRNAAAFTNLRQSKHKSAMGEMVLYF
jgi:hypothetical protein